MSHSLDIPRRLATRLTVATALATTLLLAPACATTPGGAEGASGTDDASPDGATSGSTRVSSRDVLTAERLQSSTAPNLYDAIEQLEPELLTGRRLGTPDVFIDNVRQHAGPARLKQVLVVSVAEVRYLSATAARKLPGAQSQGGALVVTLK